jgi:Mn2+/Fe2+ NRAMP family transporter
MRWGRFVVLIMLVVLVIANTLNIAADLVAVGSGMTLLHLGATWLWALISGIAITVVISSGSFHQVSRILKLQCVSLLAFVVVAVVVTHHWGAILIDTVVPHLRFDSSYVTILIAILGTTISPYLLFWQSANRLEEMREEPEGGDEPLSLARRSRARATKKQRMSRIDVFGGMALSNVVMFAIIAATAATLHVHHQTKILSAAQAAQSLRPLAGPFSSGLFALGFIGSGMLAIPVLAASGSSATSGLLGREWGFSRSIREAPMFYSLVALGTLGGTALSFVHINPIRLLVFVAIINGVIAAPLLAVVMIIAGNRRIMGDYLNGRIAKILGWATVAIMGAASVDLFASGGLGW